MNHRNDTTRDFIGAINQYRQVADEESGTRVKKKGFLQVYAFEFVAFLSIVALCYLLWAVQNRHVEKSEKFINDTNMPHYELSMHILKPQNKKLLVSFVRDNLCYKFDLEENHYMFCFGKYLSKYNGKLEDGNSIILGQYIEHEHLKWYHENVANKSEGTLKFFYGFGDICSETNRARSTDVHLECVKSFGAYREIHFDVGETEPCKYMLRFQSYFVCDLLPFAGENGLIDFSHLDDYVEELRRRPT